MSDENLPEGTRTSVRAGDAVDALRSNLSNAEIMRLFKISPTGYAGLLKKLFEARFITETDLVARGIHFRVEKTESGAPTIRVERVEQIHECDEFLDTIGILIGLLSPKSFR